MPKAEDVEGKGRETGEVGGTMGVLDTLSPKTSGALRETRKEKGIVYIDYRGDPKRIQLGYNY